VCIVQMMKPGSVETGHRSVSWPPVMSQRTQTIAPELASSIEAASGTLYKPLATNSLCAASPSLPLSYEDATREPLCRLAYRVAV
jgi:hypothetical protein